MFQRLPNAQIKAGDKPENLLNGVFQIICSYEPIYIYIYIYYSKNKWIYKWIMQHEYYIYEFWKW